MKGSPSLSMLSSVLERGQVVRGPWPGSGANEESSDVEPVSGRPGETPRRMVLGFVVRECAVALGHQPSPRELAEWANHQYDERGEFCLFGRAVSEAEAAVILAHPGREVTVRTSRSPVDSGEEPGSLFGPR